MDAKQGARERFHSLQEEILDLRNGNTSRSREKY